jgi:hypothetical protein
MLHKTTFSMALFFVLIFLSHSVWAATLEQTIKISAASGGLCIIYAEEVGGDVQAFSELNVAVMQIAEKMGYTNNLQSYLSDVHKVKKFMHDGLMKKYGSKLNIYNDWCIRVLSGFQNGLARSHGDFSD